MSFSTWQYIPCEKPEHKRYWKADESALYFSAKTDSNISRSGTTFLTKQPRYSILQHVSSQKKRRIKLFVTSKPTVSLINFLREKVPHNLEGTQKMKQLFLGEKKGVSQMKRSNAQIGKDWKDEIPFEKKWGEFRTRSGTQKRVCFLPEWTAILKTFKGDNRYGTERWKELRCYFFLCVNIINSKFTTFENVPQIFHTWKPFRFEKN